jgi:two-component system CheB/CheR fusion protein
LERELNDSREHLQTTVEELETTNEELQATNEELMASNEELQATNEELQSVNEELYTVNNEHQVKIDELTQLNDDLNNFMKATQIATLFLSAEIKVRKYTPAATKYFNLLPMDLERPLDHISHKLNIDDLISRVRHVILRREIIEQEVTTADNSLVLVKLIPYLTADNTTEGVVITITDISEFNEDLHTSLTVKKLEEDLVRFRDRCKILKQTGLYAFWTWDIHNDSIFGDDEFYQIVGREPKEVDSYESFLSHVHEGDLEQLRDAISAGLDSRDVINLQFRIIQKDGTEVPVNASGVMRFDEMDHPQEWVGTLTKS